MGWPFVFVTSIHFVKKQSQSLTSGGQWKVKYSETPLYWPLLGNGDWLLHRGCCCREMGLYRTGLIGNKAVGHYIRGGCCWGLTVMRGFIVQSFIVNQFVFRYSSDKWSLLVYWKLSKKLGESLKKESLYKCTSLVIQRTNTRCECRDSVDDTTPRTTLNSVQLSCKKLLCNSP